MRSFFSLCLLTLATAVTAAEKPRASFTENKGQWPANVLYRALFPGGALFVEKNAFTFSLAKGGQMAHHGHDHDAPEEPFHSHAYRVTFEGSQLAQGQGLLVQPQYENFFLGNDPSHWGSRCGVFGEVVLHDLYPGIDLRIDGAQGLKYEFIVQPGVDPAQISMRFEGQDELRLEEGKLRVVTSAGDVIEEEPFTYRERLIPLPSYDPLFKKAEVDCDYLLNKNRVRFSVSRSAKEVTVIDPSLTFGSYSGSTADNFGFTATYDADENLYGGGVVFDQGYPTTLGVLDDTYNGSNVDIGISKWTADGTSLVWSTYLGGSENEAPSSLVVNSLDELYVLAVTSSFDFPTSPGCFDGSFNGGVTIPLSGGFVNLSGGEGYGFASGTDIAIAHLSADATTLLGGTFIGGSANDGLNQSIALVHNYGDHFRGEIALDAVERPVVASSTQSADAPTTLGVAQTTFGGGDLDALLFRLNANLSNLEFATYCGGSNGDSGYGVQFSSSGDIYLTGGTASGNLPMVGTPLDNSNDGNTDGYVMRYGTNGQLLSSTFLGTPDYDQSFLVQLDTQDGVYVIGQTHGAYPVTPGKYTNAGSSQFIHKLSTDLSTSAWSTVIGNGQGDEDISPSAFLVSNCGQIYFSGWGGSVNSNIIGGLNSTTVGLPLTGDAYQSTTDGNDFYLMVLEPESVGLNYATFFGGQSAEHVDGGTSRFDKNGNVYQAVCAGCGSQDDFPTTPGAWSNTNNSFNCNLGVFKFNLNQPIALIDIDGPNYVCLPSSAEFNNLSTGGSSYQWNFGDNTSTSTDFEPVHTYTDTGTFTVTMILSDNDVCTPNDTASIIIAVIDPDDATIDPVDPICDGGQTQLNAHGGYQFSWFPAAGLSNTAIADPIASPDSTITYSVVVTDSCGTDTASITITVAEGEGEAGPDVTICAGSSTQITASGGGAYSWLPIGSLDNASAQSPQASPADTTIYSVTITSPEGCIAQDSLTVFVQFGLPDPQTEDTAMCLGNTVTLHVEGGDSYLWEEGEGLSAITSANPSVAPTVDSWFVVTASNACGNVKDSVFVDVQQVSATAWPDTTICPGDTVTLYATGGDVYSWSSPSSLSDPDSAVTDATPPGNTTYTVTVANLLGCSDVASLSIDLFPLPVVNTSQNTGIDFGRSTQLAGYGNGTMVWSPSASLSCDSCSFPVASPERTTTYTVELTDANGCKATADVIVFVNGSLFVPNTFTPDGDGINDSFAALATEIDEFKLFVFNRWGEEIYASTDLRLSWDGTYNGTESPIDTYVWRIDLKELNGKKRTVFGHVNLVR
ncbi:MAG: gliding motility-associated C-terminal domain-containing protein [Flavobacteriales bacterium]|nr:gliding motility-associated C-terminal domain-containing protein [Flavobacteriales bacterium]